MNKKRKKTLIAVIVTVLLLALVFVLYRYNYIPHKKYTNAQFNEKYSVSHKRNDKADTGIEIFKSSKDADGDGIDDQTDILENAKNYIAAKPKYKSKYYNTAYPNDGYGVCTDVVAFALYDAGYDLQKLVEDDIALHREDYELDEPDANIDFRRVKNLAVFFQNTAIPLTLDTKQIAEWQGGDIVIFKKHIGIVSDNRNTKGVPFVIHHASPIQADYEEDILETWGEIVGHYRISE